MKTIITLSAFIILIVSCKSWTKNVQNYDAELTAQGYMKAEIKKYEVDGCGFMIFLEDGKKLNPVDLNEDFKKDGLKVWVLYSVSKNTMSICMAGENVSVTSIRERK